MNTKSFQSDGYLSVRGVIEESIICQCKKELPALFSVPAYYEKSTTVRSVFEKSPDKFRSDISLEDIPEAEIFIGSSPLEYSGIFCELVCAENIWKLASSCLDVPLDALVLNYVQGIRKAPCFSPKISWHRDYGNNYISTENSCDMLRVFIPLQKYRHSCGETVVVPGSHCVTDMKALEKKGLEPSVFNSVSVNLEIGSGDLLAIHSKTIHGSELNETKHYRDQLVVQLAVKGVSYHTQLSKDSSEPYHMSVFTEICEGPVT